MKTTIPGHFNAVTVMLRVNDQALCTGTRFPSRMQHYTQSLFLRCNAVAVSAKFRSGRLFATVSVISRVYYDSGISSSAHI